MHTVSTYERLHRHILAWAKLQILRLAVFGPPGVEAATAPRGTATNPSAA